MALGRRWVVHKDTKQAGREKRLLTSAFADPKPASADRETAEENAESATRLGRECAIYQFELTRWGPQSTLYAGPRNEKTPHMCGGLGGGVVHNFTTAYTVYGGRRV